MSINMVLCSCPQEAADKIANEVVEKRLAACVYKLPGIWAQYLWMDAPCVKDEVTLLITTPEELGDELYEKIVDLHPSKLPVIVYLPIEAAYGSYFQSMKTQLGLTPQW